MIFGSQYNVRKKKQHQSQKYRKCPVDFSCGHIMINIGDFFTQKAN